jgi:hypothetical protein
MFKKLPVLAAFFIGHLKIIKQKPGKTTSKTPFLTMVF